MLTLELVYFALKRAVALSGGPQSAAARSCVGLGCTATLASVPLTRGEHRCYISVRTGTSEHRASLRLAKGARSRWLEDAVVSRCALHLLALSSGLTPPPQPNGREFWREWPEASPADAEAVASSGPDSLDELLAEELVIEVS